MKTLRFAFFALSLSHAAVATVPDEIRRRFEPVRDRILAEVEASPSKAQLTAVYEQMFQAMQTIDPSQLSRLHANAKGEVEASAPAHPPEARAAARTRLMATRQSLFHLYLQAWKPLGFAHWSRGANPSEALELEFLAQVNGQEYEARVDDLGRVHLTLAENETNALLVDTKGQLAFLGFEGTLKFHWWLFGSLAGSAHPEWVLMLDNVGNSPWSRLESWLLTRWFLHMTPDAQACALAVRREG